MKEILRVAGFFVCRLSLLPLLKLRHLSPPPPALAFHFPANFPGIDWPELLFCSALARSRHFQALAIKFGMKIK
ncbi:hypothetical protein TorRG33x02_008620 [Trema orientale]|uniref:Uncharacterized protein n=1 Tax=Trema orientale TaxID=63057 RepID=A0A2P5G0V8_TREOI|nr:hypothetical protein TorRG33x02_008620 [Trema orientale]